MFYNYLYKHKHHGIINTVTVDYALKNKKIMEAKLIREKDGLTKGGNLQFLEFDDIGMGFSLHEDPQVGYCAIVNAQYGPSFTWMTSRITEIMDDNNFKTENSVYTIEKY